MKKFKKKEKERRVQNSAEMPEIYAAH